MKMLRALGIRRAPRKPSLGWDFHCHLIPGVDDGVRTLDEAREAIEGLRAIGYRGGVVTPHIYADVYNNNSAGLKSAFDEFQAQITGQYSLRLAAEYHTTDALFDLIEDNDILSLSLGDRQLVLLEFPYLMPAPRGLDAISAVARAGYQPVLAHVERYRYIQADPDTWLSRLARYDTWIQCNVGSLAGMYGDQPRRFARDLLARGLPAIWGTDLHRPRQIHRYIVPGLEHLGHVDRLNAVLEEHGEVPLR